MKTGAAVQGKTGVNAKEGQLQKKCLITTIDSDIEISEIVKVTRNIPLVNMQERQKGRGTEKGKGKGKRKRERRGKETGGEVMEIGRSKFITPALPLH